MVEVGDVGGPVAAPSDLDRLAERDPGSGRRGGSERGCGRSRRAVRPRRSARPAHRWRRRSPAGSPGPMRCRRRPPPSPRAASSASTPSRPLVGGLVLPADGADPQRAVADHDPDVDGLAAVVSVQVGRDRVPVVVKRRVAVQAGVQLARSRAGRPDARTARSRCRRRPRSRWSRPAAPSARGAGSARITSPPCECRSMNPGATMRPVASMVRAACGRHASSPTCSRPSRIAQRPGPPRRRSRRPASRR